MKRTRIRRRALRAAKAVTLGLSLASVGTACSTSHPTGETDAGGDDDAMVVVDAGTDSGPVECADVWPPVTEECCELEPGGYWDPGEERCLVAVPGPFVPPAMIV